MADLLTLPELLNTDTFQNANDSDKDRAVNRWIVRANAEGRKTPGWQPSFIIDKIQESGLIPESGTFRQLPSTVPGAFGQSIKRRAVDTAGAISNIVGSIGATAEAITGVGESVEAGAEGVKRIIGFNERAEEVSRKSIEDIFKDDLDIDTAEESIDALLFGVANASASFIPLIGAAGKFGTVGAIGAGLILNVSESVKSQLDAGKDDSEAVKVGLAAGTGKALIDAFSAKIISNELTGPIGQKILRFIGNGVLEGGTEFTQELIDKFALIEADTTGAKFDELIKQVKAEGREGFLKVAAPSFIIGSAGTLVSKRSTDENAQTDQEPVGDIPGVEIPPVAGQEIAEDVPASQETIPIPEEAGDSQGVPEQVTEAVIDVTDDARQEPRITEEIEDASRQPVRIPDADTRTEEETAQDQSTAIQKEAVATPIKEAKTLTLESDEEPVETFRKLFIGKINVIEDGVDLTTEGRELEGLPRKFKGKSEPGATGFSIDQFHAEAVAENLAHPDEDPFAVALRILGGKTGVQSPKSKRSRNLKIGKAIDIAETGETFIVAGKDENGRIILVGDQVNTVDPDSVVDGQIRDATEQEIQDAVAENGDNIPDDLTQLLNKGFGPTSPTDAPPSQFKPSPTIPDAPKKDRGFSKRILADRRLDKDIKAGLSEDARKYVPRGAKITSHEADVIIEAQGDFVASLHVRNLNNDMAGDTRIMLGQKLVKRSNKRVKELKKDAGFNRKNIAGETQFAVDIIKTLDELGTKGGQLIQAFANWNLLSPEGVILDATRKMNRNKREILKRNKPKVDGTKEAIDEGNDEAADTVADGIVDKKPKQPKKTGNKKVSRATKTKVSKAKKKVAVRSRLKPKEKLAKKIADELRVAKPAKRPGPITQMVDTLFTESKKLLPKRTAPTARPKNPLDLISLSIQFPQTYQTTWDRAKNILNEKFKDDPAALASLSEYFNDFLILKEKFPETQVHKAVRNGIKELDVEIGKVVRKRFSEQFESAVSVVEKISADLISIGVEQADVDILAPDLYREFTNIATDAKRKILEQKLGKRTVTKSLKFYEKVIELSNLGALNDQKYNELFTEFLKIPTMTPELAQALTAIAEEIQDLPDNSRQQNRKIIQLTSRIEEEKGFTLGQKFEVLAYANLLSGPRTIFQVNPISAMANSLIQIGVELQVTGSKKHFSRVMSAWFNGMATKGTLEGVNAIMSGDDVLRTGSKFDTPSTSELIVYPGGVFNPFNYAKYIRRALIAGDVLVHKANTEAKSTLTALQLADQQPNLTTKERAEFLSEIMFDTKNQQEQFEKQAVDEGLKVGSLDFKLRVFELTDQARADSVLGDPNQFASKGTFNHLPEGHIGELSDKVAELTKNTRGFKFFFLFNRIIANVMNANLSYTPLGYWRAFNSNTIKDGVRPFSDSEATLNAKATLGMIGMTSLYILASAHDDDDEPFFQITAAGPRNQGRRGQLRQTGWRPYSIKIGDKYIPYIFTPLAVPFSFIGFIKDGDRYNELDEKGWIDRVSIAAVASLTVLLDVGFLSQLSDFFTAMGRGSGAPKAIFDIFARTATGTTIPNLLKQLDKYFDPTIYDADGIKTSLIRGIPIARRNLKPKLNVFGESIKSNVQGISSFIFSPTIRDDETINFLVDNRLWIPVPSKDGSFGNRTFEGNEYYEFVKLRGPFLKKLIVDNLGELKKHDRLTQKKIIARFNRRASDTAKLKLQRKIITEGGI